RSYLWQVLLNVQNVGIPFRTILSLNFTSLFIGRFLPSTMGSDLVKIYGVSRGISRSVDAVASVIALMIASSMPIFVIGPVGLIFVHTYISSHVLYMILGLSAVYFMALSLLINHRVVHFTVTLARRLLKREMSSFSRFVMAFPFFWSHKSKMLIIVLGSFVTQTMVFVVMYLASISLSQDISFSYFITFGPIITLIAMLPISISGLGVRESAFVYFFSFANVPSEVAFSISILSFLVLISPSLIGAYLYFKRGIGVDYAGKMSEPENCAASEESTPGL
ncbi:MAG: YbhN family protein, partial [Candidatus Glassbacteria bacterium]